VVGGVRGKRATRARAALDARSPTAMAPAACAEVFANADLLALILGWLLPPTQLQSLLADAEPKGAHCWVQEALKEAMALRSVSRAFARHANDVCEEMVASITRGLLLFDRVSQDYIDAQWMRQSLRRYGDGDVAEALRVVEFLYSTRFALCRIRFLVGPSRRDHQYDERDRVGDLLRARQMFRPKTMHDVYNLLCRRCFVCGCRWLDCPMADPHEATQMVWMQHPYLGHVHWEDNRGARAHLGGKWLPHTSENHLCEIIFFLDRRKRRDGTRGPDMLLHVDSEFTPLERQVLKFQKAARQLPSFEAHIARLFELRPSEVRDLQTRDGSEIFIAHLPLFHMLLGKPEPDSSLASIFGLTGAQVLRMIKKGARIAREERNLERSAGFLV